MKIDMAMGFPKEIEKAKADRLPVLIPVGTMEYHSEHCAYGCDSLVSIGIIDKITEKTAPYGDDNGGIENKKNQAVIKYIKVLDNYNG